MRIKLWTVLLVMAAAALAAAQAPTQREIELRATVRVFPDVGAGVRTVKRDAAGRYYVLLAKSVWVLDAEGKKLAEIPPPAASAKEAKKDPAQIVYGDDLDVGPDGNLYVADRGADTVKVYSPAGALVRSIPVPAPTAVVALPDGEVAVTSASLAPPRQGDRPTRLITVFDARGRAIREFAEIIELTERRDLNRFLHFGRLGSDAEYHLYYAFSYFPEPTVRKFDRFGYAKLEIELVALDIMPTAQAARREITRQERSGTLVLKPIVNAIGVDPQSQEVWLALDNRLMHFESDGTRRAVYRVFTAEGARLEPIALLVEPARLLLATDALGIYEVPRPDKKK